MKLCAYEVIKVQVPVSYSPPKSYSHCQTRFHGMNQIAFRAQRQAGQELQLARP